MNKGLSRQSKNDFLGFVQSCSHSNIKTIMSYLQVLTNCKCKTFVGSVAEMKGNQARVVIFLHPVDQLRDGKVSNAGPFARLVPLVLRWKKKLRKGSTEKMLLHTLPYFLAISRSTCEVS